MNGERAAVNPAATGTKAAARYHRTVNAGETLTLDLRLAAVRDGKPLIPRRSPPYSSTIDPMARRVSSA